MGTKHYVDAGDFDQPFEDLYYRNDYSEEDENVIPLCTQHHSRVTFVEDEPLWSYPGSWDIDENLKWKYYAEFDEDEPLIPESWCIP